MAGVCAGLAAYFGINVLFVRFVVVVSTIAHGIGAFAYVLLWILLPPFDPSVPTNTGDQQAGVRRRSGIAYAVGLLGTLVSVLEVIVTLSQGAVHVSTIWSNVQKVIAAVSSPAPGEVPKQEPSPVLVDQVMLNESPQSQPYAHVRPEPVQPEQPPFERQQAAARYLYVARLSDADHCNSQGTRLDAAPLVVRQDRANVHRDDLNVADREDERDGVFSSKSSRASLSGQLQLTPDQNNVILARTPLIGLVATAEGYRLDVLDPGSQFTGCR